MTLKELKNKLEETYGFDLACRSRKREMVDARRIYSKIAFSLGYNLREIGELIDRKHCNIIHLLNTASLATDFHKNLHDKFVLEYSFLTPLFMIKEYNKIKNIAARSEDKEKLNLIKQINNFMSNWDTNSLNTFLDTRVKLYDQLIKTTKPQKQIEKVQGAKLKRPVKNPVLC